MNNNERGQSILEVLLAMSAALIVLGAITSIVVSSMHQSVDSKSLSLASQYAQEALELAKTKTTLSNGHTYCVGTSQEFLDQACPGANINGYKREVKVESSNCGNIGSTFQKITATVSWTESDCKTAFCHSVPLSTCQ